jgi:hypothetical protein
MLIAVIILSVLLAASLIGCWLLYKAGVRQMEDNELLYDWIVDFKRDVSKTYAEINELDSQNMFSKDDEVGVVFQDMVAIIEKLNQRTQDDTQEAEGE